MKILALDLSTSTGWAIVESTLESPKMIQLIAYGNIKAKPSQAREDYPINYLWCAREIATSICEIYGNYPGIDWIIVEDTNKGQQRFSQKLLEFIHCTVFSCLRTYFTKIKIAYVNTSEWRKIISLHLTKDQRASNRKKITSKITLKHLAVQRVNSLFSLSFKQKENDIADAILLGVAFLQGAKISDGIIKKKGLPTYAN